MLSLQILRFFECIIVSAAVAAAAAPVNPSGIKLLLANGLSKFFMKNTSF